MTRQDTVLDMVRTGRNLKRIMQDKGFTVRDIQKHLRLSTPQSIYHWFDGKSLPTIDNLYALSDLFCMPIDMMLKGNRKCVFVLNGVDKCGRLYMYYERLTLRRTA